MKMITTSSFVTNCLAVIREVHNRRETVLITKDGKPVAKLVPMNTYADGIYDFLVGKGAIVGDVTAPAISFEESGDFQ